MMFNGIINYIRTEFGALRALVILNIITKIGKHDKIRRIFCIIIAKI